MGSLTRVIGRESELVLIREFVDANASRRAFVLTGRAGIGKTTLWEAAIGLARERGWRVLAARGSRAEARLRAEPVDGPPSAQAIALGFRNLLRSLAAETQLLIVIDDVQWLDESSLEVLTFLARRLREERVAFLLTRRADTSTAIERALDRGDVQCVEVSPLSFGAIRRLLIDRLGLRVSRQLLRRIVEITLANPLFVLELGRELLANGVPVAAEELPVPAGIEDLLGMRVASLASPLRRVLVALALSGDLRVGELVAVVSEGAVDDAVDRGIVRVDGDRVRAAHPLLAAAAVRSVGRAERRELHVSLAGALSDVELRAMHLALAAEEADAALSATVAEAAAVASARGARQQSVALAAHALRLTAPAAVEAAAAAGPGVQRTALYALGWARAMGGRPVDDLCGASRAVSDETAYIAAAPERVAGQRLVWGGEIRRAREALTRLLQLADERGELESYALMRLHVCELHLRAGAWDAAEALLDEWWQSTDRELMFRPKYERCRALLAAGRGDIEATERWGTLAVARGRQTGCRWDEFEGLRAVSVGWLLAHQPAKAAERLRAVWEHGEREGVQEPGVFPVAPELVQALAELDELEEAEAITARLAELAERQAHPWGMITARRCRNVVRLAGSAADVEAAEGLERAAADYEALGLHFDAARSLLSLGRAQRRRRQWGLARSAMERAAAAFDAMNSPGWAEQVRAELARVATRSPRADGELTRSEQRTAELAA